jgi:hypothetical protein
MGVHSFTLLYTLETMKCDSWASLLARIFASHCFGHEPKAKVTTLGLRQVDKLGYRVNRKDSVEVTRRDLQFTSVGTLTTLQYTRYINSKFCKIKLSAKSIKECMFNGS